ncbi:MULTISPECIES: PAAR-like domain-containing protein [unclassified Chromobacterium]|uniref:PAAR-like domain-containing protein n=1 Tax=unclassified Chromobacterium TaxID=2641838 RepID=UPI0006536237|nr:PAAR-like domain-containing protein [Chromobacterium sp. LK1]KMN30879.1 hypothetical protein VI26_20500 [Chromobacterium sp. LK1]
MGFENTSGASGQAVAPCDMCKIPVVCVPGCYVNTAKLSDAVNPCHKLLIEGAPEHNQATQVATSSGNEGSWGGCGSGAIKGTMEYLTAKPKVMTCAAPTPTHADDTTSQNTRNTTGLVVSPSQTKVRIS